MRTTGMTCAALGLLLLGTVVRGQVPSPAGARFGLKAGVTVAEVHGDDVPDDTRARDGFVAGAFAVLRSPLFEVQTEVLYAQRGFTHAQGGVTETLKLDYLEVPVLLRKDLPGAGLRPYLLLGPVLGFNIRARDKITGALTKATLDLDVKDEIKDTDFGMLAGAGVRAAHRILVEIRYVYGLSKVTENDNDLKNGTLELVAGFTF